VVPFAVDAARFPLVILRIAGDYDDREQEAFLTEVSSLLDRKKRFAVVLDLSEGGTATPTQRKRFASWIGSSDAAVKQYAVVMSLVIASTLVRGMVTAVFWVRPMPIPTETFDRLAPAEAWAREKLKSAAVR